MAAIKKFCPLFTIGASSMGVSEPQKCMKEYCEWWDTTYERCCLTVLAMMGIAIRDKHNP